MSEDKDKIILEYLSTYVEAIDDDGGAKKLYFNLDNLWEDIRERLQKEEPDADIEEV